MNCQLSEQIEEMTFAPECFTQRGLGPLLLTWIYNFIPTWINDYIHYQLLDEITYPFPKFSGTATEVEEWMNKFIAHFTGLMITYG